jgi:SNF2 family DNA or RNA helicase
LKDSTNTNLLPDRVPKLGELVQVRSRRWLVEEIVDPETPGHSPRLTLACADDDAQGQILEVFWAYEIDRRILEEEGWGDLAAKGFDPPRQFGAFLHMLRWNCVTATDPNLFQAPFRAGIKIDAYQMEPLRKVLRLPRVNLFIADDTGLGKTIEAGLIARELLLRKKCKTIVVAAKKSHESQHNIMQSLESKVIVNDWKKRVEDGVKAVQDLLQSLDRFVEHRPKGFEGFIAGDSIQGFLKYGEIIPLLNELKNLLKKEKKDIDTFSENMLKGRRKDNPPHALLAYESLTELAKRNKPSYDPEQHTVYNPDIDGLFALAGVKVTDAAVKNWRSRQRKKSKLLQK